MTSDEQDNFLKGNIHNKEGRKPLDKKSDLRIDTEKVPYFN